MPWVALKKPPRKRPTPLVRLRQAWRERLAAWGAGALGLVLLLGFWFAVAHSVAR